MASQRMTSEEKRALDQLQNDMYSDFRRAAEVHRSVGMGGGGVWHLTVKGY